MYMEKYVENFFLEFSWDIYVVIFYINLVMLVFFVLLDSDEWDSCCIVFYIVFYEVFNEDIDYWCRLLVGFGIEEFYCSIFFI